MLARENVEEHLVLIVWVVGRFWVLLVGGGERQYNAFTFQKRLYA